MVDGVDVDERCCWREARRGDRRCWKIGGVSCLERCEMASLKGEGEVQMSSGGGAGMVLVGRSNGVGATVSRAVGEVVAGVVLVS